MILEKRYDPENEKDAEEILRIFHELSVSDIELSDDELGDVDNENVIQTTKTTRVGADKVGPQTNEIPEADEDDSDDEENLPLSSLLAGNKTTDTIASKNLSNGADKYTINQKYTGHQLKMKIMNRWRFLVR